MDEACVRRIVVVGGGSAGWMAAATLARFLERGWTITLIESEEIGTVGVGEATIPQIRLFLSALGIGEAEFLEAVGGSYKLGIKFDGWLRPGESYIHTFQQPGLPLGLLTFHHYWLRARREGRVAPLDGYSLPAAAAARDRFTTRAPAPGGPLTPMAYAYHLDATLLARMLRRHGEANGVTRREGMVSAVNLRAADGHVESLTLKSGEVIAGDVFLDCSGFRGLVIGEALKVGYEDWRRWLPCDRALAVPSASAAALTPYTRATASSAGWRWRIPLQHRVGNGYVYCSQFIDDEAAQAELLAGLDTAALAEPKPLRFTTGKRHAFWEKNCVALGLASGFMEPLESTSLHLVQSGVARFLSLLPGREISPADVATYNRLTHYEFDRIRDFLVLHYKANAREGAFWAHCRDLPVPDNLAEKLELFKASGRVVRDQDELFTEASWLQVMLGQGVEPHAYHPLADVPTAAELDGFMAQVLAMTREAVDRMPDHAGFIRALAPPARAPAAPKSLAR